MSLSRALWRPTSSRRAMSSPAGVNRPAACSPPVSSNARCAARNRSGSARTMVRGTTGPGGSGSTRNATSSIDALPQIPHDAVAMKWRSATFESSNGRVSRTRIVSSGWLSAAGSPELVEAISDPSMRPSVRRKPTASSSSWPGVRIVTATATGACRGPAARISSGASPTIRSSRTSRSSPRTRTTLRVVMWRTGGRASFIADTWWRPGHARRRRATPWRHRPRRAPAAGR